MNRLLKSLHALSNAMFSVQKIVLLALVLAMVVINIAQIAGRYLFNFSIPWSEETSVVLFIVIIMLGGNIAVRNDSEIRIAFLSFKSAKANAILGLVIDIVSLITIALFTISAAMLVEHAFKFRQVISSLQLSYAYVFLVLPIGFTMIGLDKIVKIVEKIALIMGAGTRGEKL